MSETAGDPIAKAASVLNRIAEANEVLFDCNRAGFPYIRLPGRDLAEYWSLQHPRVAAWLAALAYRETGHVLTDTEVKQLVRILEAQAFERGSQVGTEGRLWELAHHEPVLQVLLAYMADKESCSELAQPLLAKLTQFAATHRLLGPASVKWPPLANVFTRILRCHIDYLSKLGIGVVLKRNSDGLRVTVFKANGHDDGSTVTPSPSSAQADPKSINGLGPGDVGDDLDTDDQIAARLLEKSPHLFETATEPEPA